jgi:hypothetical protein
MSYWKCSGCGKKESLFEGKGAELLTKQLSVPFLGQIPFSPAICRQSDIGKHYSEIIIIIMNGDYNYYIDEHYLP